MKKCYIVGAGELHGSFVPEMGDLVIAADGGYDRLISLGIAPSLVVGDLDSVKDTPEGVEIIRHKVEKDETDMHLAYLEGASRGYEEFEIYGGTGGREDHTFANYCLLYYIRQHGGRAKLIGKNTVSTVIINEEIELFGTEGATFSVFAFGKDAKDVSVLGAKYEARGADLSMSFPLGVSNSHLSGKARVSVGDGALLIISEIQQST